MSLLTGVALGGLPCTLVVPAGPTEPTQHVAQCIEYSL
jgi:hypothetical protein